MTETSINDGYFDNLVQVRKFAAEEGFKLQSYSMLNVLNQITCLQPLEIDPTVAESLLRCSYVLPLLLISTDD